MNKIIPIAVIGAGLLISMKSKEEGVAEPAILPPSPPANTTNLEQWQDVPETTNVADELEGPTFYTPGGVNGIIENAAAMEIREEQFKTWRRAEWAAYLKALINEIGAAAAMHRVWEQWYKEENKLRNFFPKAISLVFNLATYTPKAPQVGTGFNIAWNSSPEYHPGMWGYWTGDDAPFWDCQDWITWHQKLVEHYQDSQAANDVWLQAWRDERNWTVENSWLYWATSWVGLPPPVAYCPTSSNCWFIEYLYSQGMDVGTVFGNVTCNLSNVVQNISGSVQSLSEGVKTTATIISYALPIGVGVAAWWWIKNRNKNGKKKT